MNTTEEIVFLKEKVAGTKDAIIFQNAERILVDTIAAALHMVSSQDVVNTLKGDSPPPKKPLGMEDAMNALATLQKLGAQYGVDIPTFKGKTQFGIWLLTNYGRSLLNYG